MLGQNAKIVLMDIILSFKQKNVSAKNARELIAYSMGEILFPVIAIMEKHYIKLKNM